MNEVESESFKESISLPAAPECLKEPSVSQMKEQQIIAGLFEHVVLRVQNKIFSQSGIKLRYEKREPEN